MIMYGAADGSSGKGALQKPGSLVTRAHKVGGVN